MLSVEMLQRQGKESKITLFGMSGNMKSTQYILLLGHILKQDKLLGP